MSRRSRRWLKILLPVVLFVGFLLWFLHGNHEGPGQATAVRVPAQVLEQRAQAQGTAPKQILFGDVHVHTTFSTDAFAWSLPLMQGDGAHPPADACDFARYCSGLDFFALTDHAEGLSARHWAETKEAIRQCNALAGDAENPDVVAFTGFEWTQIGLTPKDHYGHKNLFYKHTDDARLPTRPIGAGGLARQLGSPNMPAKVLQVPLRDIGNRQRYMNFMRFQRENGSMSECPAGVDVRQLPADCREYAETPKLLFDKLNQWGHDVMVIPHGSTWGFYTPLGYEFNKQLTAQDHDPARQKLLEIFSGHGNSEEYRSWRAVSTTSAGELECPAPTDDYEPCCHRAGELIRARCGSISAEECEARVKRARLAYVRAGTSGHRTVMGATPEDWGDCGQCRDCYLPAFSYRPGGAVQGVLAHTDFDHPLGPKSYPFGFIASSDNHSARPGTGYKELNRNSNTEARGPVNEFAMSVAVGEPEKKDPEPRVIDQKTVDFPTFFWLQDAERQASYFLTGGLVAVHSAGRSRDAIWSALERREVYGTSGPKILVWFDLVNGPEGEVPMGSEVRVAEQPRFRVRALGAFKQQPGCPDWSVKSVGAERLQHLCRGECEHPGDERHRIDRFEVVRIRPQTQRGQALESRIDDPWKVHECPAEPRGQPCELSFVDPTFDGDSSRHIYYVRVLQEPTPTVNGAALRCERDESGRCERAKPCYGDYRTPKDDDCLAPAAERAWSSPIFVDPAAVFHRTQPDADAGADAEDAARDR